MSIAARSAIISALTTAFTTFDPTMPFQSDPNVAFTPPNGEPWTRLTILDGSHNVAGIGGATNLYRGPVLAFIDAFTPLGTGSGRAVEICDAGRAALRNFNSAGLRFVSFEAGPEGPSEGWYRKQQIVVFDHSERG